MAAVSAPAGAVSPCTDAATDSIRRRLLPVLTYFLDDDDMLQCGRLEAKRSRRRAATVRPSTAL